MKFIEMDPSPLCASLILEEQMNEMLFILQGNEASAEGPILGLRRASC